MEQRSIKYIQYALAAFIVISFPLRFTTDNHAIYLYIAFMSYPASLIIVTLAIKYLGWWQSKSIVKCIALYAASSITGVGNAIERITDIIYLGNFAYLNEIGSMLKDFGQIIFFVPLVSIFVIPYIVIKNRREMKGKATWLLIVVSYLSIADFLGVVAAT